MNLVTALQEKKIVVSEENIDGSLIYLCGVCKQYLVYYMGKYHFTCECHKKELERDEKETARIPVHSDRVPEFVRSGTD